MTTAEILQNDFAPILQKVHTQKLEILKFSSSWEHKLSRSQILRFVTSFFQKAHDILINKKLMISMVKSKQRIKRTIKEFKSGVHKNTTESELLAKAKFAFKAVTCNHYS